MVLVECRFGDAAAVEMTVDSGLAFGYIGPISSKTGPDEPLDSVRTGALPRESGGRGSSESLGAWRST